MNDRTATQAINDHIDALISERVEEHMKEYGGDAEELEESFRYEVEDEFRCSGEPSGIPQREYSRYYDCHEVATVLPDGTAVGWTYWFGGGKHGEPESIPWVDDAYFVTVRQETKVVNVYERRTSETP